MAGNTPSNQALKATSYTRTGIGNAPLPEGVEAANTIVMGSNLFVYTLAHENFHILLDSGHRTGESERSLFHPTENSTSVTSTKRIGPFIISTGDTIGSNDPDTTDIRNNVENLP